VKECVQWVTAGAESWNRWRQENQETLPTLQGADLEGADLRGFDLSTAQLSRTNLFQANLSEANLTGATLWKTDLRCAEVKQASLANASLRQVDLRASLVEDCSFIGSDLREARLRGAELFECDFDRADLREADLTEAVLSRCDFGYAKFSHTNLAGARLWHSKGLNTVEHHGPSWLDPLSAESIGPDLEGFLRGIGWPERLIEHWAALTSEGISFYSCFISYSHVDKTFAHRLHDSLQREGVRCWLDGHALLPGDDAKDEIDRGIRLWDKVVLCCSEAALTSWWVDQEIEKAIQKEERLWRERGEKVGALIPIRLDDYVFDGWESGKRSEIVRRHIGDFSDWPDDQEKFEREFERLVLALSADPLARGPAPSPKL
jgi:uncharacterized protein YjbI with pentapeptide repeats